MGVTCLLRSLYKHATTVTQGSVFGMHELYSTVASAAVECCLASEKLDILPALLHGCQTQLFMI